MDSRIDWHCAIPRMLKTMSMLFIFWANLSCLAWTSRWWAPPLKQLLCGFCTVPINPHLSHLLLSLKGIPGLFQACLKGPGMCWHDSPQSACSERIWQQYDVCSDCLSKCSKLIQMKFPTVFEDKVLHSIHIFISFAGRWMSWVFSIFNRRHTSSGLWKPLKNLCSSHSLLSKTCFQHF